MDSAAGKKLEERTSEEKKTKDEVPPEARLEELIANGVTPMVLDDDKTGGSDDMEWESDQWEVVGHAVDWTTAKANYKVVAGMRLGETEAAQMWTVPYTHLTLPTIACVRLLVGADSSTQKR